MIMFYSSYIYIYITYLFRTRILNETYKKYNWRVSLINLSYKRKSD